MGSYYKQNKHTKKTQRLKKIFGDDEYVYSFNHDDSITVIYVYPNSSIYINM